MTGKIVRVNHPASEDGMCVRSINHVQMRQHGVRFYHACLLALVLFLATGATASAQFDDEQDGSDAMIAEALEEAYEHLEGARLQEAVKILDDVLAFDSTVSQAYFLRGVAWSHLDSSFRAANDFVRAIEFDSTDGYPYLWLADILLRENMAEQAVHFGWEAVRRLEESAYAHDVFSRALRQEGYDSLAIVHSRLAVEHDSTNARYYGNLALAELRTEDFPAALRSFTRASELDAASTDYLEGIGVCALAMRRWEQSRAALEQCIANGGDTAVCLGMLGVIAREHGDASFKQKIEAELLTLYGTKARATAACAYSYANMARDLDGALEAVNEALALDGRDVHVLWAAGMIHGFRDDARAVCGMYRRLADIDPEAAAQLDKQLASWPTLPGLCADARENYAEAEALYAKHRGASYTDQATGLMFPSRIGRFDYRSMYIYPQSGQGVSFRYESDPEDSLFAVMTVYLYPAPAGSHGPGFLLDASGNRILETDSKDSNTLKVFTLSDAAPSFTAEYERAKREIMETFADATLQLESRRVVTDGNSGPIGLSASYSYPAEEGYEVSTELYLFALNDRFVKIRVSYPRALAWDAALPIGEAIDALNWEK